MVRNDRDERATIILDFLLGIYNYSTADIARIIVVSRIVVYDQDPSNIAMVRVPDNVKDYEDNEIENYKGKQCGEGIRIFSIR